MRRGPIQILAAMALLLGSTTPVAAAAPPNDAFDAAIELNSFPVSQTVDMTEATMAADDPWCDFLSGSVWYRYTATTEETLTAAVPADEASTRLCIYPDSPAASSWWWITPGDIRTISLDAGHTYYLLLGVLDNAPTATLDLDVGPALFDLEVSILSTVAHRASGAAVISGTITCSSNAQPPTLIIEVTQPIGPKRTAQAADYRQIETCGPTPTAWQMILHSTYAFVPGSATLRYEVGACDFAENCDRDLMTLGIRLRKG